MKIIVRLVTLFFTNVVISSQSVDVEQIIDSAQRSDPTVLDQNAFNSATSYQARARNNAKFYAQDLPDEQQLRNYYVLSCIYLSTNGVSNPRTQELIPQGARVSSWNNTSEWIINNNYCEWYGITCDNDKNVVEIDFFNNNLSGNWPNEVALLGDQLEKLELFSNKFLYSEEPKWLLRMSSLKYLFFGGTSFTANGVSPYLRGCVNLRELDISNSGWTNGPIRQESFEPLTQLEYLDLGENTYDTTNGDLPDAIKYSNSIEYLYMDNVKFEPNQPDLGIISSMELLFETWNDFTSFSGGLPSSLGSISTLTSFSCTYCNLSGPLPPELANSNLDRLWLYGNDLTGSIPSEWGTKLTRLRYLYLERNNLTGTIPSSLCNLKYTDPPLQLGVDCDMEDVNTCASCCGPECGHVPDEFVGNVGGIFCFSGNSLAEVKDVGLVRMADLQLGDLVKVSSNKFEPIYSFAHKNADIVSADYLKITTDIDRPSLEVSGDHMIVLASGKIVPASALQTNDILMTETEEEVAVVRSIQSITRQGAFAPFTASGTIVVNGIVASNYIAYQQGSEYMKIGLMETPFSYHWIAHTFNSVHRLAVMLFGISIEESYTDDGISHWVDLPHKIFSLVLEQNNSILIAVLVVPAIAVFSAVSFVETTIMSNNPMILTVSCILLATAVVASRRFFSIKITKGK